MMPKNSQSLRFALLALTLVLPTLYCARAEPPKKATASTAPDTQPGKAPAKITAKGKSAAWQKVDQLVADQKLQEAAEQVDKIRAAARAAGDDDEWTRALISAVQLRIALGEFETAVRFLKDQPWPRGELHRVALDLFYASLLTQYASAYSWEIGQREKVESRAAGDREARSAAVIDLKAWTREQIHAAAAAAYGDIWARRESLSRQPVSALSDYLQQNNYPKGVRDTLRDAVTYLYVDLLADTSGWRPEQSNEIYQLDLAALIRGGAAKPPVKLDDPAVHPLVKIGAVLADVEDWHKGQGPSGREAALFARLERLRRLHDSFTSTADRAQIRADLEGRLPAFSDVPFYAMGLWQLASFVQAQGLPDSWVRARDIANQGLQKYPDSVGGQRCLNLVKWIEAPDYQLNAMTSDGAGKRSLQVTHKNLPALYFRAYPMDLLDRVKNARDYNLLPDWQDLRKLAQQGSAPYAWTVELPATPDYQEHQTYVSPPLTKAGLYVVVASAKKDFSQDNNRVLSVNLLITDLVLSLRGASDGGFDVRALSGSSGKPVPGADVLLFRFDWGKGHQQVDRRTTDEQGAAHLAYRDNKNGGMYFVIGKKGAELAYEGNGIGMYKTEEATQATSSLIYSDRSVYRPLQKIFYKVLGYTGSPRDARYHVLAHAPVTVSLYDPNNQKVDSKLLSTNDFGSAAGEFNIPSGRLLGQWRIDSSLGGASYLRVEEYKRPTFEASLKDPESPLRLNRPATLIGEARYYFGLPVAGGAVKWRVTREPVYPDSWYYYGGFGGFGVRSSTQTVAAGSAAVEKDGKFRFSFTPKADENGDTPDLSYRYQVSVDITDEGGETRSAERGFRLGLCSVEARISSEAAFFVSGDKAGAGWTVLRSDLSGTPRPGKGSWRLYLLKQPAQTLLPADLPVPSTSPGTGQGNSQARYQTPGDRLRPRWDSGRDSLAMRLHEWADGAEKGRGELTHGEKGEAKLNLGDLPAGAYRLRYDTVDDFGKSYTTAKEFVVAAAGAARTGLAVPALLLAERAAVPVGQTARFLVLSGLADQRLFLDIYRGGVAVEHRVIDAGAAGHDRTLIEIPVTEARRGGFGVTLTGVRDHQMLEGSASVFVPWDDKALEVSFATFRDRIRPGAKETFRVTVKGHGGAALEAGAAELLAYMYDRSLDLFAPHNPPSPLSLYPNRTGTGWLRNSLGQSSGQWISDKDFTSIPGNPSLQGDRLSFLDGYGIGGMGRRGGRVMLHRAATGFAQPMAAAAPAPAAPAEAEAQEMAKADVASQTVANKGEARSRAPAKDKAGDDHDGDGIPDRADKEAGAAVPLRQNFSETAFWQPALLSGADGSAAIEFTVPDSVTSWNVWVHAVTRDLRGGSVVKETRSIKDLMVRPYLPRFLREGDQAELKVVVNNASAQEQKGQVRFEITDPDTGKSLAGDFGLPPGALSQAFTVAPSGGADVTFALKAPHRVGPVAFQVTATAGDLSDGELRPLPVLPGRMHLSQSRLVTLKDQDQKTLTFADLAQGAAGDPTRINDQLVVTLDAQLFYSVLSALPYLINYPYECTEQTLNRFLSTGIVSSLYKDYPAVAKMAQEFSKRQTPLETFADIDPNRKMTLEESPWLQEAQGGKDAGQGLVNALDPRIAAAQRDASINKLRKAQTAIGGFPWWPGGPPSPYMTLYILHGFAKATEFGVDIPKDMVQNAFGYLSRHFRDEVRQRMLKDDCCWEFLTFFNYVASSFPDVNSLTAAERKEILESSFRHWKQHSPYLKAYLALTLARAGRKQDAQKVFASVMDSSKTTADQGTFWAPEDRSWLWYNDTIETHAFALRTLMELSPGDRRKDGLVQWLLLNKKMNQWKSTRATAEVIYSLVRYLKQEGALGTREDATVQVGGQTTSFVFEPDHYTGKKNQIVIAGPRLDADPQGLSSVVVSKGSKGLLFASATWNFSTEKLPAQERGDFFFVSRSYFKREQSGQGFVLKPLAEGATVAPGDEVEVHISLRSKAPAEYVHLRDPRAAGLEPENAVSRYKWDLGIGWYEEVRDSGANFFFESLPQGEYTFKYRLRANLKGQFRVGPATVQSMYAPEFSAYSTGTVLSVK